MESDEIIFNQDGSAASKDVRTGYLSGPGFANEPVRFSVVNGIALFQGCIDMGPAEAVEEHSAVQRGQLANATSARADTGVSGPIEAMGVGLPASSTFLWTNGIVPFVIDVGLPDTGRVTQAIAHIHENTPIRFVARTTQANYVRFVRNPGQNWSSSPIGMRGGEQLIRLSDGANMGVIVHECYHSLGVLHEQSRCDRDQFVQIRYDNITPGFEQNFDKFCPAQGFQDYVEYDYGSIMHYGATGFSKNGQPTIVPLKQGVTIGQRNGLSINDRLTIAHMYARFFGTGHTGVWRSGTGGYGLWVNSSWQSFHEKWQQWNQQGLRLVDIDVRRVGNEDRYSGVWLPGTGAYGLWGNASWDSFVAKWQEWGQQGLRLVDINAHVVGGVTRYTGVWLAGTGGYGLWANASWDSFVAKSQEWAQQGLRLVDINVHQDGGGNRYSGVFLPGTDAYFLWADVPWESFRARWQQLGAQGLRLVDYEFTSPVMADVGDLDIAGRPTAAIGVDDVPVGYGGIFGDDGAAVYPSPAHEAVLATAGSVAVGDGSGGYRRHADTAAPASTAVADGTGGAVLEPSAPSTAAEAANGMGEAVLEPSAPNKTPVGSNGAGGTGGPMLDTTDAESEERRATAGKATATTAVDSRR